VLEAGAFEIAVGGCQPGYEALLNGSTGVLTGSLDITENMTLTKL
jgi:hypothetical protein